MTSPESLMQVARVLAAQAGTVAIEGRSSAHVAATKSSSIDIVTQMDLRVERLLRERIAALRPDDAILGEEGDDVDGTSGVTWVLDPIDGTVNYLYGLPAFAVSVAAVTGPPTPAAWTVQGGAVYDGSGTLWSASRGGGAWRDDAPLRRTECPSLESTLLGTGFQYIAQRRRRQGEILAGVLGAVRDIRRLGSASVDLCLVAAGQLDAYYEHGLQPWDFAAASLIAQEAGVMVASIEGGPPDGRLTIAAMPGAWTALRDALVDAGAAYSWDEFSL